MDSDSLASANQSSLNFSRRTFLRKAAKTVLGAGTLSLGGIVATAAGIVNSASGLPTRNKGGLAILCSSPDAILDHVGMPFFAVYRATIENSFGFKAKYVITDATTEDFVKVITDYDIENVTLLGHGNHVCWNATDKTMYAEDYASAVLSGRKMQGKLLKHTCGEIPAPGRYTPYALALRETLIEQAKDFESRVGIPYNKTIETLETQLVPIAHLPSQDPKYVSWVLDVSRKRIKRDLFGTPLFRNGNVAHWDRIASPLDFMTDPYATGPKQQSTIVRTLQELLAEVNTPSRGS